MKKLIGLVFVGVFLLGCNTTPTKPSGSNLQLDLKKTQRLGLALYNAMLSSDATDEATSREADLLEMASEELLCEGKYQAVRIRDTESNLERIYLVLQPPKSAGIQFGRHLRFDFLLGTNDLEELTLSTKTCLLVPNTEEDSAAVFITHLMSPTPNEFHVYLSLLHDQPIYVSTEQGVWKVENGVISRSDT